MRYLSRGLLLALVLVLFATQALAGADGSLLTERMNQAYESGRQVGAVFSAKLGDGLQMFLPGETFNAVQQLLADTRIVARWAKDEAGLPVVGFEIGIQDVQVLDGTMRMAEDTVAVETSLLPGKTVLMPLNSLGELAQQQPLPVQVDGQTAALFEGALETYLGIVTSWAMETDGLFTQSEIETASTDIRGGAVRSDHLLVTAAQLKDLLVRLLGEFEKDAELQSALDAFLSANGDYEGSMSDAAKELYESARGLAPLDGALKLDMYSGSEGDLVGLDLLMDPMFEGLAGTAFAQYDMLTEDGYEAYAFQARLGFEDGGMAATKVSYSVEESHTEPVLKSDLLLRGMFQPTDADLISQITLTDARQTEQSEGQERLTDTIEFTMESLGPDGTGRDGGSAQPSVAISTQAITNEEASDAFNSDISVLLQALGMEFATLYLNLAADEYVPADTSGNMVIDLSVTTPEEQDALAEELQMGLMTALMNAMQAVPPELLQMLQGE